MDPIASQPFESLGYNFIPQQFLSEGKVGLGPPDLRRLPLLG